ncbi:MAG: PH domain-containing protein [Lachnospiraceae bacterium]|nr:PH domain-containing protein [Lachnospiraceae bacterium]
MAKEKKTEAGTAQVWRDRKRTLFGLPLSFTVYTLDEQRLFIKRGFFNQREDEVRLYRIMDMSLTRTLGQRIFGVGTIHCCSADKTLGDFDIISVKKPRMVKELMSGLVEEQRDKKRVTTREYLHDGEGHDDTDHENDPIDEDYPPMEADDPELDQTERI